MDAHEEFESLVSSIPTLGDILFRIFAAASAPDSRVDPGIVIDGVSRKAMDDGELRGRLVDFVANYLDGESGLELRGQLGNAIAPHLVSASAPGNRRTIWALVAIEPCYIMSEIRNSWDEQQLTVLCDSAVAEIVRIVSDNLVFDIRRAGRGYPAGAELSKDSFSGTSLLDVFDRIERYHPELLRWGIRRSLARACEVVLGLRPALLGRLAAECDHPVVQLKLGEAMSRLRLDDHRYTLGWISHGASDSLIALAIFETCRTANRIYNDAHVHSEQTVSPERHRWSTELQSAEDLPAAATDLLVELVRRLEHLDGIRGARWLAELVVSVPRRLLTDFASGSRERIAEECAISLASVMDRTANAMTIMDDVSDRVQSVRLRAVLLREIARHLDSRQDIQEQLFSRVRDSLRSAFAGARSSYLLDLSSHDDVTWTSAVADSLVGSEGDPLAWLLEYARELPLTQWDAEDNRQQFAVAADAVGHVFQIGFICVAQRQSLGNPIAAESVRNFVNVYWAHAEFASRRVVNTATAGMIQANAVIVATKHCDFDDDWLRSLADLPYMFTRALVTAFSNIQDSETRDSVTLSLTRRYFREAPRDAEQLYYWGTLALQMSKRYPHTHEIAGMARDILLALDIDPHHEHGAQRLLLAVGLAAAASSVAPQEMESLARAAAAQYRRLGAASEGVEDLNELLNVAGWVIDLG